jgi:hypothetical protein
VPSGSVALAAMVMVGLYGKTAPAAGDVMLAVGGWFCVGAGLLTVIVDTELVVVAPSLSIALAVSAYVPAPTPLQLKVYGAVRSSPSFVVPL